MLTVNLGPLVLPLAPLLLLIFLLGTAWAVRRLVRDCAGGGDAGAEAAEAAETSVWWAAAAGLVAARLAHVLSHWKLYAAAPLDMADVRDGGFQLLPGVVIGVAVLLWRSRRFSAPQARRVVFTAVGALGLWQLSGLGLQALYPAPGQRLQDIAVPLLPAGNPAPAAQAFAGPQPQPQPLTLQAIAQQAGGRPVVLNLWASWCGPCRAEMPVLQRARQAHPDVLFVLVNQGESEATIAAFLQRERLQLGPTWRDPAAALGPALGSTGLPTTVYFDAQGHRQGAHVGVLTDAALGVIVSRIRPASALPRIGHGAGAGAGTVAGG